MKKRMNRVLSVPVKKNRWLPLIGLYCMTGISVFLMGCQQVPDEVFRRMEHYGQGGQIKKADADYCTIEELRNAKIEDIDHVPDNLQLPEKIDFSGIESIGTHVLKRYENYDENREKIAEMFGIRNPDWQLVEADSNWYEYDDEHSTYLAVYENGEISYINGEEYENLSDSQWPVTVERVYLNREECPQMICHLNSGQVSLSDILTSTQEWVDGCEILQDEFDYELRTVYVKEKQSQKHRVAMLFQRMYKGVGLNYIAYGDGILDMVSLPYMGSWIDVELDEIGKPSFFYDNVKVYIDEESPVDEVLDFQSAVNLVEQKLSGFSGLKVCEIRVEYMLYAEKSENEDKKGGINIYREGAVFHTKPVYSFLIEFGEDDENTLSFVESNGYVYVNVDMMDGTVITNFEERNFHD